MIKQRSLVGFVITLIMIQHIQAMWEKSLLGVKVITAGAVIGVGAKKAHTMKKNLDTSLDDLPDAPPSVKKIVYNGLVQYNVSHAASVPIKMCNDVDTWAVLNDKVIAVNPYIAQRIDSGDKDLIVQSEAIKKHEINHLLNKDTHRRMYAWVAAPCTVQAVSSSASYVFNAAFKRKGPQSMWSCMGRSSIACGSMAPKWVLSVLIVIGYVRYQEAEADRFACEHAESREELVAFKSFFDGVAKNNQKIIALSVADYDQMDQKKKKEVEWYFTFVSDIEHPHPAERAAMVQRYIDKWDEEHRG